MIKLERETEKETEKKKQRETERKKERASEREREREREIKSGRNFNALRCTLFHQFHYAQACRHKQHY